MNFTDKIFSIKHTSDLSHNLFSILGIQIKVKRNVFHKYNKMPIINNRIVFNNFYGKGYGCNPKYIANEIIKQNLPSELLWLTKETSNIFPKEIKVVDYNSEKTLEALSTAKIIISNTRLNYFIGLGFKKKPEQIYIQTWHGGLAFKKIEKDIENNKNYNRYLKLAKIDSKYINYLLSPSEFDTECLKHNFYYDGEILKYGYPRNDLFFYDEEKKNKIKERVFKELGIPKDKKIVLYAPTFRDSKSLDMYKIDTKNLLNTLHNKYNSDFVFVIRLHPNMQSKSVEMSELLPDSINVSDYDDIQELLLVSDILITDYSSSIWDFCSAEAKPVFIYATDIESYKKERGFYIPLENMPFPVAESNDKLITKVKNFDGEKYKSELKEFIKKRGIFDDGNASKRVVEVIKKELRNKK